MSDQPEVGVPSVPKVPATKAHYREPDRSFVNPAALSGRRQGGVWIYAAALLLAAAADFANFYQIIQYAIPGTDSLLLLLLVLGVTGVVLFLAHIAGVLARIRAAHPAAPAPRTFIVLALLGWLLLGLGGLYVRLIHNDDVAAGPGPVVLHQPSAAPTPSSEPSPSVAPTASDEPTPAPTGSESVATLEPDEKTAAAILFTALYVGTGVVALICGYLTHDPARAALRAARKAYDDAVEDAANSAHDLVLAQGAELVETTRIKNERAAAAHEAAKLEAAEAEAKRYVRARVVAGLQNPTVTDAYTHLDPPDDVKPA